MPIIYYNSHMWTPLALTLGHLVMMLAALLHVHSQQTPSSMTTWAWWEKEYQKLLTVKLSFGDTNASYFSSWARHLCLISQWHVDHQHWKKQNQYWYVNKLKYAILHQSEQTKFWSVPTCKQNALSKHSKKIHASGSAFIQKTHLQNKKQNKIYQSQTTAMLRLYFLLLNI